MALVIWLFYELGMANLKCHMPIMVNKAVYAMRFATGAELPRGLFFGERVGGPRVGQGNKFGVGNMGFFRVRGLQS